MPPAYAMNTSAAHTLNGDTAADATTTVVIPPSVIKEAAHWLMQLHSGEMTDAERQVFERWRAISPAHDLAWQRASQLTLKLGQLPPKLGMSALDRPQRIDRRAFIKSLSVVMAIAPAGVLSYRYAPWREWSSDYSTATGEISHISLDDGSRITMNTASGIDVAFDDQFRLVNLRTGEILIETAPDTASVHRPFIVQTAQGRLRALGTRFVVRQADGRSHVSVLQGAVEIAPSSLRKPAMVITAGQQTSFSSEEAGPPQVVDETVSAWSQGILYAEKMRLADFIAELARYRSGILRCDPAVGELRISGAFQLRDTENILAALQQTLPVRMHWITRYWGTVVARS